MYICGKDLEKLYNVYNVKDIERMICVFEMKISVI